MPGRDVGVLIPAAGLGRRMGGVQKPLMELGGRPVLEWALRPFVDHPSVCEVVVAVPADVVADPPAWLGALPIRLVEGGQTRTDSVQIALAALDDAVRRVVIHDGARPILRREWIDACLEICDHGDGAVIGYPAVDTIKEVSESGFVVSTPERSELWQVQTPQAFPRDLLERAYRQRGSDDAPTDDAALVEQSGGRVRVVRGDASNVKLTRPEDVAVIEAWLSLEEGAP